MRPTREMPEPDSRRSLRSWKARRPSGAMSEEAGKTPHASQDKGSVSVVQRYALIGFWICVILLFVALRPTEFPTRGNVLVILSSQSVTVLLGLAVTLTLRLGDLDLSFGAVMVTAGIVFADCNATHHLAVWISVALALAFGVLAGVANAIMVVYIGLPSFVATLGSMTVIEGIGYALSSSQVITGMNDGFLHMLESGPDGVPVAVIIGWVVFIGIWFLYEYTAFGRFLLFIGGNRRAANLLGLRVRRTRCLAYIFGGLLYAIAGVVLVGTVAAADPTVGGQYLLPPLAGAFLGTTVIQMGRFHAIGTMIGIYVLATISIGLELLGAQSWTGYVFNGLALVLAVSFARFAPGLSGETASISITE